MEIIKIIENFDHKILEKNGYTFDIWEAGYISKDSATIIMTHRDGHKRKVVQYRPDVKDQHMANLRQLRNIGAIED